MQPDDAACRLSTPCISRKGNLDIDRNGRISFLRSNLAGSTPHTSRAPAYPGSPCRRVPSAEQMPLPLLPQSSHGFGTSPLTQQLLPNHEQLCTDYRSHNRAHMAPNHFHSSHCPQYAYSPSKGKRAHDFQSCAQTVKKPMGGIGGLASPPILDRKSASPFGAVKRGEAPVRRFSRDFACKIASLHEQTAGRAIYGSTSARVQTLEKVPIALCRHPDAYFISGLRDLARS